VAMRSFPRIYENDFFHDVDLQSHALMRQCDVAKRHLTPAGAVQ
jgi:hypothetical protein